MLLEIHRSLKNKLLLDIFEVKVLAWYQ
jgi:hypothetical protein